MTSDSGRRIEIGSLLFGAALFVAAHVALLATWRRWFDPAGAYPVWFLNSGRAVAVTTAWLLIVPLIGALAVPPARDAVGRRMLSVALGAVAAMAGVLFVTGPGTIFPIVLAVGAVLVAAPVAAGTYIAALARARPVRRS